ncbi:MAG: hypothetical protein ACKVOU_03705 [Cytophagales bacterium]
MKKNNITTFAVFGGVLAVAVFFLLRKKSTTANTTKPIEDLKSQPQSNVRTTSNEMAPIPLVSPILKNLIPTSIPPTPSQPIKANLLQEVSSILNQRGIRLNPERIKRFILENPNDTAQQIVDKMV